MKYWPDKPKPTCPICEKQVDSLTEHESSHSLAEVYQRLDTRFSSKLDAVQDGVTKATSDLIGKMAVVLDERIKKIESGAPAPKPGGSTPKGAKTEPKEPGELEESEESGEVLWGDQRAQAKIAASAASDTAQGLERAGWSREDITNFMRSSGPFLAGLGNLVAATRAGGGSREPTPFEVAGRRMFESSARIMDAVFTEVGKRVGKEKIAPKKVEHE